MDEFHTENANSDGYGHVTANMIARLAETRPWVLLVGILGFVATGFMVAASGFMLLAGALTPMAEFGGAATVGAAVLYLLISVVYFFISLYLVRYAGSIKSLLTTRQPVHLERALEHQRSFWRIVGITSVVYLGLAMIALVFVTIAATIAAS